MSQVFVLARRPVGVPKLEDFDLVSLQEDPLGDGELRIEPVTFSVDPYLRGRMSDARSYVAPFEVGAPIVSAGIGKIVESKAEGFAAGELVRGEFPWASSFVLGTSGLWKLPSDLEVDPSAYLGVLGMPGTTAYSGMTDIGQPKAGETVVISAASGAVGAVAGQIAKRAGARVVGVAGGAEKCLFVQETLGFDECIDHRALDLKAALTDACPNGIDVYFENVGGELQRLVFPRLNAFGRVVMCGMVAEYNDTEPRPGPNLMMVVRNRLRIQGLIVSDKPERFAEWRALATPWVRDGSLKYREDIVDGLENAPDALIGILGGRNFGKLLVRVGADPA